MNSILLVVLINICKTTIIQIDYLNFFLTEKIPISIANGKLTFMITLDLNTQYNLIFINPSFQYPFRSSRVINDTIEKVIKNELRKGIEIEDTFKFNSKNENDLGSIHFYYFNSDSSSISGVLAMTFIFNDQSQSIIHQLKQNGIIDKLAFALTRNGNSGHLYLGGIIQKETINLKHTYCNVKGIDGHWDCLLRKVTLQSNITMIQYDNQDHYAYFSSSLDFIFAPMNFFNLLVNYYNSSLLLNNCYMSSRMYTTLFCENNPVLFIGNITFTIEDYNYAIDARKLWKCFNLYCSLLIVGNKLNNGWILGPAFFTQINILFDYEDKKIHFYSDKNIVTHFSLEATPSLCHSYLKQLTIVNILIICIGIIIEFKTMLITKSKIVL